MISSVTCYSVFGRQFDTLSLHLKYLYPLTTNSTSTTISLKKVHTCAQRYIYKDICYRIVCNFKKLETFEIMLVKEPIHNIKQITPSRLLLLGEKQFQLN